ncbi:MAG: hypothetical protein IJT91_02035 [Clostridia bacterium]|nr:hypothetical protein [Clostridia bacterium]
MKKSYEKPGFTLSVFESKDPISSMGDWELGFAKGPIDPYRGGFGDIDDEGSGNRDKESYDYNTSDLGGPGSMSTP